MTFKLTPEEEIALAEADKTQAWGATGSQFDRWYASVSRALHRAIEEGKNRGRVLLATPIRAQVEEFHLAMGLPVYPMPIEPLRERLELRLNLIAEEFSELLTAAGYCYQDGEVVRTAKYDPHGTTCKYPDAPFDMVEVADALGDLDYTIEGMRLELGIDGAPIAAAIHTTNMAKVGGPVREDGKRLKPPGWLPPDIRAELVKQGWVPPVEQVTASEAYDEETI